MPQEMGNCTQLTYIFVSGNKLIGSLPNSLSNLNNLKRLDISDIVITSPVHYQISREYPTLKGRFSVDSFLGNPGLCGYPLPNNCPPSK
ncbi:hypothetical protein MKX03_023650 [Papaver bracteatum]|nr:hypothetical protein MKX03_023650 [Papaver bracteatum]